MIIAMKHLLSILVLFSFATHSFSHDLEAAINSDLPANGPDFAESSSLNTASFVDAGAGTS